MFFFLLLENGIICPITVDYHINSMFIFMHFHDNDSNLNLKKHSILEFKNVERETILPLSESVFIE